MNWQNSAATLTPCQLRRQAPSASASWQNRGNRLRGVHFSHTEAKDRIEHEAFYELLYESIDEG
jgi:hypothetical protein